MGNKLGRRRQVVGERYTRPQGLYQHRDIDHKKLRKLILDSKLAPCYPGDEESALDLEECLICFLYYPSLNRSRCCKKGICTECFLQLKPSDSFRPTQCPFCNTRNYAVEYHGVRTKEEKGMELLEEQRVIEAQIRVRQQELQEEERMQKQRELNSSRRIQTPAEVEYWDIPNMPSLRHPTPSTEVIFSQDSWTVPASTRPLHSRKHREDNCDLDLEDIMVMEAIWLSIQDHGTQRDSGSGTNALSAPSFSEDCCHSNAVASIEASTSGGLAYAVAALAERQSMLGDSTYEIGMGTSSAAFHMLQRSGSLPTENERVVEPYPPESWIEVSPRSGSAAVSSTEENEWAIDHVSEIAEAGTSDVSSNITVDGGQGAFSPPEGISVAGASQLLPDSFEEQMMLAMVISLAEVRARRNPQGLTWM